MAEDAGRALAAVISHQVRIHSALVAAQDAVHAAIEPPAPEDLDLRSLFIDAVVDHRWDDARLYHGYWTAHFDDLDGQEAELRLGIASHDFTMARARVWKLLLAFPEARDRLVPLWYKTWLSDKTFWRKFPYDMKPGVDFDKLKALGGGSTISLKVRLNGTTIAMIKPDSTQRQTYYRGEIAAFRLCALMRCGFKVPHNTEVRFRLRDFLRAYGISSLHQRTGYSRRFKDIILDIDPDGTQWVDATLKAWVPGFTTYPIEHTSGWIHLLNGYISPHKLATMSLEDALRPMRGKERAYIKAMLDRGGNTTGLDFARQLSNLHVFDYLLNNWDRYSGMFWGVNCQWNHGHFVSIDNGAVLQVGDFGKTTRARLHKIRLFSRSTVEAIRLMDHDLTRKLMFPDLAHHPKDAARFENFWRRRQDFLDWIDLLIEHHGEERTLGLP